MMICSCKYQEHSYDYINVRWLEYLLLDMEAKLILYLIIKTIYWNANVIINKTHCMRMIESKWVWAGKGMYQILRKYILLSIMYDIVVIINIVITNIDSLNHKINDRYTIWYLLLTFYQNIALWNPSTKSIL